MPNKEEFTEKQKPLREQSPQSTASQTTAAQGGSSGWITSLVYWHECRVCACLPACRTKRHTSNISSLDTSMRQWPAWGCWSESSCLRTFSFWTKSLSYLWAGSSSSSTEPSLGSGSGWLGSFSWHWWLEKNRSIKITPKAAAKGAASNAPYTKGTEKRVR